MSKTGRKEPRWILFMVAKCAIVHNEMITELYQEYLEKGKTKMQSIGIIMHKILRIIYGMLKNNTPYDPKIDKTKGDAVCTRADPVAVFFEAQGIPWTDLTSSEQKKMIRAALALKFERYSELRGYQDEEDLAPSEEDELARIVKELGPLDDAAEMAYQRMKAQTEEDDIELAEEDLDVDFIRGDEIDLDEIIHEQVHLTIPMKSLCREDCLGLCPECGRNLNAGDCPCDRDQGHAAFLKLKNLKIEGD